MDYRRILLRSMRARTCLFEAIPGVQYKRFAKADVVEMLVAGGTKDDVAILDKVTPNVPLLAPFKQCLSCHHYLRH